MVKNITEDIVIPESPKVIPGEKVNVYVPNATNDVKGIAKFYDKQFVITDENGVGLSGEFLGSVLHHKVWDSNDNVDAVKETNTVYSNITCQVVDKRTDEGTSYKDVTGSLLVFNKEYSSVVYSTEVLFAEGRVWYRGVSAPSVGEANAKYMFEPLFDEYITTDRLAKNSVTTEKLQDSSVTSAKISNLSVETGTLATGSVTSVKVCKQAIHGSAIPVTVPNVVSNAVHIYPKSINGNDIADSGVKSANLDNNSVTTDKLANNNVTEDKLSEELKSRLETLGGAFDEVHYNGTTGVLTFAKAEGGDTVEINLPLEQVISSAEYDADSKDIVVQIQNGSTLYIPLDAISENLINHIVNEFTAFEEKMNAEHQDIMDSVNAVRDSIFEVQIAPPLMRLSDAIVLTTPTLAVLANIS